MSTLSPAVLEMLAQFNPKDTPERQKVLALRIVERLRIEQQDKPTSNSVMKQHKTPYQQRKIRYDSSCSDCGGYLEAGSVAWLTVGQPPMCNGCHAKQ